MAMALTRQTDEPNQVRLYHITHLDNLASIVSSGAIFPYSQLRKLGLKSRSIAYSHLQQKRDALSVPLSPYGDLHDYVPWSFAARSPMLYSAWRGALGPDVLQTDIVHLVSDVKQVQQLKLNFVFTDGHRSLPSFLLFPKISINLQRC